MKKVFWTVLFFTLLVFVSNGQAHDNGLDIESLQLVDTSITCESCRDGCGYDIPAGDGCNTCGGTAYCKKDTNGNEHWLSDGSSMCTTIYCGGSLNEIENPFKGGVN